MKKIIIEVDDDLKHEFIQTCAKLNKKQKDIVTDLIRLFVKKNLLNRGAK